MEVLRRGLSGARSPTQKVAQAKPGHLSLLTTIPGWTMGLHPYDLMHVLFLGVCAHLVGSVLIDLCELGHWSGPNLRAKLAKAWRAFKKWAREHGVTSSQPMFKPGNLGRGKKPVLAEIKAKAHNCKVLVTWLAAVTELCPRKYGSHGQQMATCVYAMAHFSWLLDRNKSWKLEEALAVQLRQTGLMFLLVYQQLSKWGVSHLKRLYGWKPKFHYFEHMLDIMESERIHPRLWMNWHEESLLGNTTSIASRTHRLTAPERFLDRYRLSPINPDQN